MKIITVLRLLIIRCTVERKNMFHIYSLIADSGIKFTHKICFNYEFNEFENHQQPNFIKKVLNKDCFKSFIIKVVIFDNNV